MRWRPTLAALGVLAVVAALLVAMSSASSPTVVAAGAEVVAPDAAAARSAATNGDVSGARGDSTQAVPDSAAPAGGAADAAAGAGQVESNAGAESNGAAATQPGDGPDGSAVADPIDGPDGAATGDEGPQASVNPAGPDEVPTICPAPSDPFFNLYTVGIDCYWLVIGGEQHQELTPEELELIGTVPFVAGSVAEPLGRPARKIRHGPPGEPGAPRLYLTFDDGPSRRWTRPTLDLLDRYGARATFFPVGAYAGSNFDLIQEIHSRGHTLGTHLWSHELAALHNEDLFRQELRASADLLGNYGTNCLRTPYGITNENIFEWAGDEGFEIVLWGDVDPLDWEFPSIDELTTRILNGVRPGTILLLHERTGANTLAALDAVLGALDAAGWRFDEPICPLQF